MQLLKWVKCSSLETQVDISIIGKLSSVTIKINKYSCIGLIKTNIF